MSQNNTSLKYLVSISKGKKPRFEIDQFQEGLLPYLSMDYLRGKNAASFYCDEATDSIVKVEDNDLLILWDGSNAGEIVYGKVGALSSTMAKIDIISEKVHKKFLTYFLIHSQPHLKANTVGMGIPHVNGDELRNLVVYLPSLIEQSQIAAFLDRKTAQIDTIIEKKQKLLQLLDGKKKSVINEAVTGQKVWNGNAWVEPSEVKDSGIEWLGNIPMEWEISAIKYVATIKARLGWKGLKAEEYVEKGYGFLATPDIKNKDIDYSKINFITKERYDESPEIMLENDDVLLVKDGSTLGIVSIVKNLPFPSTINSSIAIIRVFDIRLNSEFLYWFLRSNYLQNVVEFLKQGQGVPHLFQKDIKDFALCIPPLDQQLKIVQLISETLNKLDLVQQKIIVQIDKLKEYRQSLISEAVTGKIEIGEK